MTDQQKIQELLTRGVENIYPDKDFLEKLLKSGKKLTLYTGYDPTGPSLHLGHLITVLKLKQFQDLGHQVIMLIGDFTGMIGDPSDKGSARVQQTRKQVLDNCKNYQKQVANILNFKGKNKAILKYNSSWLGKLKFADVLDLASNFTVQRMLERDMFENRIKDGKPIYVHEFMYPLMQGYDSVAMDVDGEVGGNDQTFNMLAGRTLMKTLKNKEKFVLTLKLLADSNTGKKMGKTEGNAINLDETPEEIYGKVMAWSDGLIIPGFEECTFVPTEEVKKIKQSLESGQNPRDAKMKLAFELVGLIYSQEAAKKAQENFKTIFQNKEKPQDIQETETKTSLLIDLLVETNLTKTKSEARRVIQEGGLKVDDKKITDIETVLEKGDHLIQKGKRHFVKVTIK